MARKTLKWYKRGFWWRRLTQNRKYKDKLFRFLFQNKKDLLDLYNALNSTNYTNPEDLEIVTMEDIIFLKMKNDLSFIIANKLNLYEHQSTVNPNMPLRGLIYFALQYEGIASAGEESIYAPNCLRLPTPEYIVFYNGTNVLEDETELYLSDSFSDGRGSGCLECKCRVLNINRGHNNEILKHCRRLWEYSEFVSEVNTYLHQGASTKEAIQLAIDYCIKQNILKDILIKQKTEVLHMLLTEFDEKKYKRSLLRAGYERGEQEGYSKGQQEGRNQVLKILIQKKLQKGKNIEEIATDLEEHPDTIQEIIHTINPEK